MSKVRNLPEILTLDDNDLFYAVDESAGPNGGRKIKKSSLKTAVAQSPAEIKVAYEANADTNAFTDAEKTKLAGIEAGATADQIASEVPYSNAVSGLVSTNVQAALDEVAAESQADFRPSIVSGRILHYSGGTARFDDILYNLTAGNILLNQNITSGEVYVDLDGIVKQTGSGVTAPPLSIVFAKFSTDLNNITSLTDERVKNAQNIVRGTLSDVRDVRAGASASAGSSGRISDAMHKHNILTGAPSTQSTNQANAEGTSANLARADHIHNIPTAAAVNTGTANADGTSPNFSRADHVHNTVVANSIASATVDATTTSLTDVLVTGMTLTPAAGTYLVIFRGSTTNSANGAERNFFSIYSGGAQVPYSEARIGIGGGATVGVGTHAIVTVNGAEAIETRWRVAGGTGTVNRRSMTIIRLG